MAFDVVVIDRTKTTKYLGSATELSVAKQLAIDAYCDMNEIETPREFYNWEWILGEWFDTCRFVRNGLSFEILMNNS